MGHNKILESIQDNGKFEYYTKCSQCHKNWRKKESFKFTKIFENKRQYLKMPKIFENKRQYLKMPKIFENKRQYIKMPKIFGIKKEKPSEKNLEPIIVKVSPQKKLIKKPQTNFYAL